MLDAIILLLGYSSSSTAVLFQMRQEEVEAHVDDIFSRLDTNRDGVVTIEEFVEACQRVSVKYRVPQQVLDNIWGQERPLYTGFKK